MKSFFWRQGPYLAPTPGSALTRNMGSLWWCTALLLAAPTDEARLIGQWGLGGQPFLVLSAKGQGTMDGEPMRWSVVSGKLVLSDGEESEQVAYRLEGDRLTLDLEGTALTLERLGKADASPKPSSPPTSPNPSPSQEPLAQLLVSSPWCSFSYSNGTTRTSRVLFLPDGTWSVGANRETQWSGQNGSLYGQNSSGGAGRWAVKGGQLLMSAPPETPELTPVATTVTKNSNGYPIVTADGKEYSQCQ